MSGRREANRSSRVSEVRSQKICKIPFFLLTARYLLNPQTRPSSALRLAAGLLGRCVRLLSSNGCLSAARLRVNPPRPSVSSRIL